jgi:hypothetical protein
MVAHRMAAVIAAVLVTARLIGSLAAADPAKLPGGSLNPRTARHTLVGKTGSGGSRGFGVWEDTW